MNDADEDDLDVYDGGPNQTRNRTAYDIGSEKDDQIIIGGKANKGRPKPEIVRGFILVATVSSILSLQEVDAGGHIL